MVCKNYLTSPPSSQVILPFIVTAFLLSFKKTSSQLFLGHANKKLSVIMTFPAKSVGGVNYMV